MNDKDTTEGRNSLGNAPDSASPVDDPEAFRDTCQTDRDALSPRETADCAGSGLAELYENEEDGGS